MDSRLVRGDCTICQQRRILGLHILQVSSHGSQEESDASMGQGEFRCCACIDEHGEEPVTCTKAKGTAAANWWALLDPPSSLRDVPEGYLEMSQFSIQMLGYTEVAKIVTDPTHHFFNGHGAERVWPAAGVLTRFMLTRPCAGLKVVELGAGCGLPGIMLAKHKAHVVTTDVPWLMQLMEYNFEANFADQDPHRPQAMPLRWGSVPDAQAVRAAFGGAPDIVLAADVVYRVEDLDPLLHSISLLGCNEVVTSVVERGNVVSAFVKMIRVFGWSVDCIEDGLCASGSRPSDTVHIFRLVRHCGMSLQPKLAETAVEKAVPAQRSHGRQRLQAGFGRNARAGRKAGGRKNARKAVQSFAAEIAGA